MRLKKGLFITFEGIEGSGKSTQIELFCRYLEEADLPYVRTVEPGGTKIGDAIRNVLLAVEHAEMKPSTELLLYAASRAQHVGEIIGPALERGEVVVSDRFSDSTLAYQGYGRGLRMDLIHQLNSICTGGISPDLTFLLDLDVELGMKRNREASKIDRLELEAVAFHKRVRDGYYAIAASAPERVHIVKGEESINSVADHVRVIFLDFLKREDYVI